MSHSRTLRERRLGSQGLIGSELGLGCMGLSAGYGAAVTEAEGLQLLQRAVELGVTFFDTAEMYGPFTNEVLVGKALRQVHDRVVIATKFGFAVSPGVRRPSGLDSSPAHIRAVCEASLQRLGIETIDLFYQHRVDPKVPIEEVAGAVGALVRAGKVRYFGLSEAGAKTIRRAHAVHPVSAVQTEYSLWSRDPEREILPLCRELGIGFVPYSPLGRGFLAGAAIALSADDFRRTQPRWQGEALQKNLGLVETLTRLAQQRGHTPAQLALAWLLHQGPDIVPIPGTSRISRLEENLTATELRLTPDDIAAIEAAVPAAAVQGERNDAIGRSMIGL
jgi:aryl-alcohol dehydrogenase-like predicted oxidoreductase